MTKPIRIALIAAAVLFLSVPSRAQGFYWTLAYEPSIPLGGIRHATPTPGLAGGAIGARYLISKRWSLGLGGHWNQFSENRSRSTYVFDDGAITGAVFRRVWTASILSEAHYYLACENAINPYVGVGAGFTWLSNELLVSDLAFEELAHGFTVSPEAGILVAFDRDLFEPDRFPMQSVVIGVRYSIGTASARDVTNTSFVGLTLGLLTY
jgi:hypothetical protein